MQMVLNPLLFVCFQPNAGPFFFFGSVSSHASFSFCLICPCCPKTKNKYKQRRRLKYGWHRDANWHSLNPPPALCALSPTVCMCARHFVFPASLAVPFPALIHFSSLPSSFATAYSLKRGSQMPHQQGLPFITRQIHCAPPFLSSIHPNVPSSPQ